MLYQRRTFTCPASKNTSQENWDRAFLSAEEYIFKYGSSALSACCSATIYVDKTISGDLEDVSFFRYCIECGKGV